MKKEYNRPTSGGSSNLDHVPYPQDLKKNADFEEFEKRYQDKFEFTQEVLDEKVQYLIIISCKLLKK